MQQVEIALKCYRDVSLRKGKVRVSYLASALPSHRVAREDPIDPTITLVGYSRSDLILSIRIIACSPVFSAQQH